MTRARSILTLFAQRMGNRDSKQLYTVIEECLDNLHERPQIDSEISPQDDLVDILDIIGGEHRKWLVSLWGGHRVSQEPLLTKGGEVIAEPLFWFKTNGKAYACFGLETPRQRIIQKLEDFGVSLLEVGQVIPGTAKV